MTEQTTTADRILWLDLETDGLDISRCQVLEVGCVLTKSFADGLEVVGEFSSPVWPLFGEAALVEMPEPVREMHRASGLWDACLADDDLTPELVGVRWLSWLIEQGAVNYTTTTGSLVVGGSGIDRFDVPIIERVFPVIAREFHWRRMDVSAMKLLLNELDCAGLIPKQTGQAHRALADAHWARNVAWTMSHLIHDARDTMVIRQWGTGKPLKISTRTGSPAPGMEAFRTLDALTTVDPPAWAVWRPGDEELCEELDPASEAGTALWAGNVRHVAAEPVDVLAEQRRRAAEKFFDKVRARLRGRR
jgi:oligoribonuclease (3'-5' exoribonuclease)